MRAISLFAGIGGFDISAERVGFEIACQVEIDDYCNKVLEKHWPKVPRHRDIKTFNAEQYVGTELVMGGPPCQPASIAGKQRGAEDDRWLWPQTVAVVERVKPTFCLFENPTGLLTLNNGVEFERVLSALESLGYAVQPIVVPACAVDARHRRDRVWILGANTNIKPSSKQERQHQRAENYGGSGVNGLVAWPTVADANGGLSNGEREQIRPRRNASDNGGSDVANPVSMRESQSEGSKSDEWRRVSDGSENVPDTMQHGLEGQRQVTSGIGTEQHDSGNYCRWEPEPAICRVVAGLPDWLDRLDLEPCLRHIEHYANQANVSPAEALRMVRGTYAQGQVLERETGGPNDVCSPSILLPFLRRIGASQSRQHVSETGAQISKETLRVLRDNASVAGASYRPRLPQQQIGEHSDTLQKLSRFLARTCKENWEKYRGTYAADRNDRLRCLGNSIVPQVAEILLRTMLTSQ